jgi:hypothetical protein
VPFTRIEKNMKVNLKLHSLRPVYIHELNDVDLNSKVDECARMIYTLNTVAIWTGKDGIRQSDRISLTVLLRAQLSVHAAKLVLTTSGNP